jgi:hypothetical protein
MASRVPWWSPRDPIGSVAGGASPTSGAGQRVGSDTPPVCCDGIGNPETSVNTVGGDTASTLLSASQPQMADRISGVSI